MKTARNTLFITAALICAALVLVPFVSAAGPGQGSNPGTFMQGPAQGGSADQGQGTMMTPGQDQNANQGTTGDSRQMPHDHGFGNMTEGNTSWDGLGLNANNITFGPPPADMNATADGNLTLGGMPPGGHGWGNLTPPDGNMTALNMTALNGTAPLNGGGTMSGPGHQNGISSGAGAQQDTGASQTQSQDQKDSDLIAAFLKWLHGWGGSTS